MYRTSLLLSAVLFCCQVKAQHRAFITYLNQILKASSVQHWADREDAGRMHVDSAFTIDAKGILSVTVRYQHTADSFYCIRQAVSFNKIKEAVDDDFFVLTTEENAVHTFTSDQWNSTKLVLSDTTNLLHIGESRHDFSITKLQVLLKQFKQTLK